MRVDVKTEGDERAAFALHQVGRRLEIPELAAPAVYAVLNETYERKFDNWNGYLYDTGRLRDSLTDDSSPDALREAHYGAGIRFGSDVIYARYHARALLDVPKETDTLIATVFSEFFLEPWERDRYSISARGGERYYSRRGAGGRFQ